MLQTDKRTPGGCSERWGGFWMVEVTIRSVYGGSANVSVMFSCKYDLGGGSRYMASNLLYLPTLL